MLKQNFREETFDIVKRIKNVNCFKTKGSAVLEREEHKWCHLLVLEDYETFRCFHYA